MSDFSPYITKALREIKVFSGTSDWLVHVFLNPERQNPVTIKSSVPEIFKIRSIKDRKLIFAGGNVDKEKPEFSYAQATAWYSAIIMDNVVVDLNDLTQQQSKTGRTELPETEYTTMIGVPAIDQFSTPQVSNQPKSVSGAVTFTCKLAPKDVIHNQPLLKSTEKHANLIVDSAVFGNVLQNELTIKMPGITYDVLPPVVKVTDPETNWLFPEGNKPRPAMKFADDWEQIFPSGYAPHHALAEFQQEQKSQRDAAQYYEKNF